MPCTRSGTVRLANRLANPEPVKSAGRRSGLHRSQPNRSSSSKLRRAIASRDRASGGGSSPTPGASKVATSAQPSSSGLISNSSSITKAREAGGTHPFRAQRRRGHALGVGSRPGRVGSSSCPRRGPSGSHPRRPEMLQPGPLAQSLAHLTTRDPCRTKPSRSPGCWVYERFERRVGSRADSSRTAIWRTLPDRVTV
jgi:hypothetical protein